MKNNKNNLQKNPLKNIYTDKNFLCDNILKDIEKYRLINQKKQIIDDLAELCLGYIKNKAASIKKQERLRVIDEKKPKKSLSNGLCKKDLQNLPDWIKSNIKEAYLMGKSGRIASLKGKKYHLNNPLNDLSGGEWTYFLRSVINTRYPANGNDGFAHNIRKIHPSPKPPQLMRDIIKFFTKKDEWVLDYFMGVGGTLLGASLCDRKAVGIDLNPKYIEAYKKASEALGLKKQETMRGDALKLLESERLKTIIGKEKLSFICIDPPYGDMMNRKKTGEAAKRKESTEATPFSNLSNDLGNVNFQSFLKLLKKSVEQALDLLKNKRYVVVFTKDFQPSGKNSNLLHADIINTLNEIEALRYVGMKIWADESINLYPYGYPYAFVPNQLHQYILIFRKEL